MMRLGLSLLAVLALCGVASAQTPQLSRLCTGTAASCTAVSTTNPLPGGITQGGNTAQVSLDGAMSVNTPASPQFQDSFSPRSTPPSTGPRRTPPARRRHPRASSSSIRRPRPARGAASRPSRPLPRSASARRHGACWPRSRCWRRPTRCGCSASSRSPAPRPPRFRSPTAISIASTAPVRCSLKSGRPASRSVLHQRHDGLSARGELPRHLRDRVPRQPGSIHLRRCAGREPSSCVRHQPVNQVLPLSALSIAGSTPPAASAVMNLSALALSVISPATIKSAGQAPTVNDPAMVVTSPPYGAGARRLPATPRAPRAPSSGR
jgi:hypothetical protein